MSVAEQPAGGDPVRPSAQNPLPSPEQLCTVCGAALETQREVKLRACWSHTYDESVLLHGRLQRYCQQCNSFHTLEHFEGLQRSCRWQLERRRQRRRVAALASCTPQSDEPPTQSRRPRRAAALQHHHLGAAAGDEPEDPPAPVDSPPKRQRQAPPAAGGPPAQWLAPGGAEQHPAYAGRWELITDPALVQAIYAAVEANQQPAAAAHPQAAALLSRLFRLSGSRGQQQPAQQPVSQPLPLASYGSLAPPQPFRGLSESEREALAEQLGRNMTRLMTEQRQRFGIPPPGSAHLPPRLPPSAYGPGGLPPLALELERKPSMTKEEAEAQLATAAVVMALALKCELAAAERQQQA